MKDPKKDILWRVYLVYLLICIFGLTVLGKVVQLQFSEGDYWKRIADSTTIKNITIEAKRGNILAEDGSILATSLPTYDLFWDASVVDDKLYEEKSDSLAYCLSNLFKDRSTSEYKNILNKGYHAKSTYFLIKKSNHLNEKDIITYNILQKVKKFPIWKVGKNKGGLIPLQKDIRKMPFDLLAERTIGYYKKPEKKRGKVTPGIYIGLEGAFADKLKGSSGVMPMQRISGGYYKPLDEESGIEPKDGFDIITSIDINIQDVAEASLTHMLDSLDAQYGCVVLMEVKTGEVKAIVNLGKDKNGNYNEIDNYASRVRSDPGSTFKLISLMAALEDGVIKDLDEKFDVNGGKCIFGKGDTVRDSHQGADGFLTVQQIFEKSSNVGAAKVIDKGYRNNMKMFYDRLVKMSVTKTLNLDIEEIAPLIKKPPYPLVSLHRMAYGYEVELTPLQILTFYNAVANNGIMVKPQLVKELKQTGKSIKVFEPEVINPAIASPKTIAFAKQMLEGVVQHGTARNLMKDFHVKIAGKTGTARIIENGRYVKKYQSAFVGYFPADKPLYSCIVVINDAKGIYYGSLVSGPVFKDIADKVYATRLDIHKQSEDTTTYITMPFAASGNQKDLYTIFKSLNYPTTSANPNAGWAKTVSADNRIDFNEIPVQNGIMPDVSGMSIKNALYLLETMGLKVKFFGVGTVNHQSISAGSAITKGQLINLNLASSIPLTKPIINKPKTIVKDTTKKDINIKNVEKFDNKIKSEEDKKKKEKVINQTKKEIAKEVKAEANNEKKIKPQKEIKVKPKNNKKGSIKYKKKKETSKKSTKSKNKVEKVK